MSVLWRNYYFAEDLKCKRLDKWSLRTHDFNKHKTAWLIVKQLGSAILELGFRDRKKITESYFITRTNAVPEQMQEYILHWSISSWEVKQH